MTIKEILASLSDEQRETLMIAFDAKDQASLEYETGKFIGVHLVMPQPNVEITERAGCWWSGENK